jgi:CheY-like chemotaxis protein
MKQALIVDDCATTRVVLGTIFRELGFTCIKASSVAEATPLIKQRFDLVTIDYELHGMLGTELVRRIRASEHSPRIVIISAHELGSYAAKLGCAFVLKADYMAMRAEVARMFR